MPIYEYMCTKCNHKFDLLQKMSDEPTQHCPECNGNTAIRLVSAAGFQLKGTGWYATDFKNSGKPPVVKSADTPSTTTEKSAETPKTASKTPEATTSVRTKGDSHEK